MTDTTLIIDGKITGYDERTGVLTISAPFSDWYILSKREIKKVKVQLVDGRTISDKQRKFCYALINAIAEWSGNDRLSTKQYMKMEFWAEHLDDLNDRIFSLSNAPMSLVAEFQRFLVRFVVDNGVSLNFSLIDKVDDIQDYIYACLINKKCCICGRKADLHHVDHVGIGRNREEIVHVGMESLPLCREHHNECHVEGQDTFNAKWHIDKGIIIDSTICKIYGLRKEKK